MTTTYGMSVKWTTPDGGRHQVGASGFLTADEARETVWRMAKDSGWTPRKWWHWWRMNDTPNPIDASLKARG